jgi:hypothetical protein
MKLDHGVFYAVTHKKIKRAMRGISILVIRWNGREYRESKPCKHCSLLIKTIGIKYISYSDNHGNIICEKAKYLQSEHLSMARKSKIAK